jgi:hypothetical protein
MLKHFKKLVLLVTALCALALGGSVAAQASTHTATHHRAVHRAHAAHGTESEEGSESTEGDAPGGHEDPPGAEEDHQFEGEE